jgi:hypothetical protein
LVASQGRSKTNIKRKVEERREKMEGRDSGEVDGRIRRQEGKGRWRETAERNAELLFSSGVEEAKRE